MVDDRIARVDEAVAGFCAAWANGCGPAVDEWAARFPELAPELEIALHRVTVAPRADDTRTLKPVADPAHIAAIDAARQAADWDQLWHVAAHVAADAAPGEGAGSPANSSRPFRVTPHIDGYDVIHELHRGGQGIVYQALEKATKRKVAIKVLLEGPYASDHVRKRFEREIELAASLKHPNIVAVYHSGLTRDGRQFCVMDYVRGVPLHKYVRDQKLALEGVLRLFEKVCDAVNYAHQKGVIHRDLKPSNILVNVEGSPQVLDFGLAKQLGGPEQTLISTTGQVVGTLPYLSPEQARGNPDEVDTRSDVYSLGIVLYEILTGHFPYPVIGQMVDVLRHIANTEPTPPSRSWKADSGVTQRASGRRLKPGSCPIDDEVQTIVLRALTKERGRRYQSAAELGKDVLHYLKNEPIEAKRDSTYYVFGKQIWRYRFHVTVICVSLMGILLSAFGLYSANQARRNEQMRTSAERTRVIKIKALSDNLARMGDEALTKNETHYGLAYLLAANAIIETRLSECFEDQVAQRDYALTCLRLSEIFTRLGNGAEAQRMQGLAIEYGAVISDPGKTIR